ncbi:MAG: metallophosphoesterase [Gemmatimonadaceae bacterium]|nr:metallophosphoesterase [Gemmatimonadaceae bacterium]
MRIGLISDTHDRLPAVRALLQEFQQRQVEMVLHAGDFCSAFALQPFLEYGAPMVGVFGRNDGDREGLRSTAAQCLACELFEAPHSTQIGEHKILLTHDLADVTERSVMAHTLVIHGHEHKQEMKARGETLIVNPGEACGWVFGAPCAAIIDLDSKHVEFVKLDAAEWKW